MIVSFYNSINNFVCQLLLILTNIQFICTFNLSNSSAYEIISLCGFLLLFPDGFYQIFIVQCCCQQYCVIFPCFTKVHCQDVKLQLIFDNLILWLCKIHINNSYSYIFINSLGLKIMKHIIKIVLFFISKLQAFIFLAGLDIQNNIKYRWWEDTFCLASDFRGQHSVFLN